MEPPASEQSPVAPIVAAAMPIAALSGPAATIDDVPIKALDTLFVIFAQKIGKKVKEISLSRSIKDLVGGKSTA